MLPVTFQFLIAMIAYVRIEADVVDAARRIDPRELTDRNDKECADTPKVRLPARPAQQRHAQIGPAQRLEHRRGGRECAPSRRAASASTMPPRRFPAFADEQIQRRNSSPDWG